MQMYSELLVICVEHVGYEKKKVCPEDRLYMLKIKKLSCYRTSYLSFSIKALLITTLTLRGFTCRVTGV